MALNSYNKRLNRGGNKDKVAIITGGSREIGFATVEKFLQEGAVIILKSYTRDKE